MKTRHLKIEGLELEVPENLKKAHEKAYAAAFLHKVYGGDVMREKSPELYQEFYGQNRSAVLTQKNLQNAGLWGYEAALRTLGQRNQPHFEPTHHTQGESHPKDLVQLMAKMRDNPSFIPENAW